MISDSELERLVDLIVSILEEHQSGQRVLTQLTISFVDDRLQILEKIDVKSDRKTH